MEGRRCASAGVGRVRRGVGYTPFKFDDRLSLAKRRAERPAESGGPLLQQNSAIAPIAARSAVWGSQRHRWSGGIGARGGPGQEAPAPLSPPAHACACAGKRIPCRGRAVMVQHASGCLQYRLGEQRLICDTPVHGGPAVARLSMAGWAPGSEPAAGVRTAGGLGASGWQPHCDAAMHAHDGASMQWWGELPSLGCRLSTHGLAAWRGSMAGQHGGALAHASPHALNLGRESACAAAPQPADTPTLRLLN